MCAPTLARLTFMLALPSPGFMDTDVIRQHPSMRCVSLTTCMQQNRAFHPSFVLSLMARRSSNRTKLPVGSSSHSAHRPVAPPRRARTKVRFRAHCAPLVDLPTKLGHRCSTRLNHQRRRDRLQRGRRHRRGRCTCSSRQPT
jgi:hypothetical protein